NIDGLSEQTILDQMCNMTMAATAYKMRKASDKEAAIMITQGFTGQLKDQSPDAPSTLIYIIIKNFVGDPSTFKDRIETQLMNLRCPTMSDYRWYKDVFMSKVMIRDDAHAPFWKERFVAALPKLFSEKYYKNYKHSIEVCTDTKIQQKIKQESITGKRELDTFCYQYGITPEKAPSGQHKIKKKIFYKKPKHNIDKPLYYEQKHYRKAYKNPKEKPKSSNKKKQVTCWKYKKQGHYANKCTTEQKINKIKNKEIKHALTAILINSESEEESIYEDSSETEDYFIQQLDLMSEEESSEGN
ncbi:hypothetical protein S83_034551, partial [Arachis hypogaea]